MNDDDVKSQYAKHFSLTYVDTKARNQDEVFTLPGGRCPARPQCTAGLPPNLSSCLPSADRCTWSGPSPMRMKRA